MTIRVRLPSGQLQRVLIEDEEGETIAMLRTRIQTQGLIPGNSTLSIKDVMYDCTDAEGRNVTRLATLDMSPGEIVHVVDLAPKGLRQAKKEVADAEASSPPHALPSSAPAEPTSSAISTSPTARTSKKKVTTSISEIQRLKKEMVKVARQKTSGLRVVAVSPSVAGVLRRVASGGLALLLGRSMEENEGPRGMAGKTRAMSSEGGAKEVRECIEVHAACEVFRGLALPDDISRAALVSLSLVAEIARRLGLDVVGCAIGLAPSAEGGGRKGSAKPACASGGRKIASSSSSSTDATADKPQLWSPGHVFAALQLRPLTTSKRFVVLSAAEDSASGADKIKAPATATTGQTPSLKPKPPPRMTGPAASSRSSSSGKAAPKTALNTKRTPRRKGSSIDAATLAATPGLILEAFELSDQAWLMLDRGILPRSRAECTLPPKPKPRVDRTRGRLMRAGEQKVVADPLYLNGPILTQSSESTEIDPYLLAVPLPIVTIGTGSVAAKKRKGGITTTTTPPLPPWRPPALGVGYEHSFPPPADMLDGPTRAKAEKHVVHILSTLAGGGGGGGRGGAAASKFSGLDIVARMRDVHLLAHLGVGLVEPETLAVLCEALGRGASELPQGVLMSLDLARQSLESSARGGAAEEEEEL